MVKKSRKKKESEGATSIPADVKRYINIIREQSNEDMVRHITRVRAEADKDLTRYMGALMEEHRDQIKGIGERFIDFDRKLDLHTEMLETHEQWFGNIDRKLISHTEMIGELAEDVATLTGNVATLTGNVAMLTEDVSVIKEKVTSIEVTLKTKVDREEFAVLEHRVAVVEATV